MLAPHEARYALECLLEGRMGDAERERLRRGLTDYVDNVGSSYATLELTHRHEASESDRHAADASQKDNELRTLRGVVDQCKGEVAEMADAALRLCDLLAGRSMSADEADAVAALRASMKGLQARELIATLRDSVRKFAALSVITRMLHKLRVTDDVRAAAEKWAKKQLRL